MSAYTISLVLVAFFAFIAKLCTKRHPGSLRPADEGERKVFVCLAALVLICVSGFRYHVGTDYVSYMHSYPWRATHAWENILEFKEPALNMIAALGSLIYDDFVTMFFLVALITIGLNVRTINKYSVDIFVALMLYIFIGAWHNSMNGIRQYLAAAVIFSGYRYLLDQNFLKYMLVIAVAACCHVTAVIMLPIYFLVNRKVNATNIILLASVAVAMRYSSEFFFNIMSSVKGTDQTQYEYMNTGVTIGRTLVAIAPLFLPLLVRKGLMDNKEYRLCFNLLLLNAAFMVGTSNSAYLARIGIYTEIYATLAFPLFLAGMRPAVRMLLIPLILVLYFSFWYYELGVRGLLENYHWIFER